MSEADKELKAALAENGTFDPDKADAIKKDLVTDFGAKARFVERIMWGYLLACVCVCIYAWRAFDRASSTKDIVFYAILFLVGFETTILLKLWAHVVNTKISLLKEIKLLRLAKSGHTEGSEKYTRPGLSRWERKAWILAVVAGGLIIPNLLLPPIKVDKSDSRCETHIALDTNGGGTVITERRYRNWELMPIMSFEVVGNVTDEYRWLDKEGHPLPYQVTQKDGRKHYTVELPLPVKHQCWVSYLQIMKSPSLAQKQEDNKWIYRANHHSTGRLNSYKETVLIPDKAELLSLEPEGPMEQVKSSHLNQQSFLLGQRKQNIPFQYTIEYQLPPEENPKAELKADTID